MLGQQHNLGEQSNGTFKVERISDVCHECANVIPRGQAVYIEHFKSLFCPRCAGMYKRWDKKTEGQL